MKKSETSIPFLLQVPKVKTVIGRMDFVIDRCKGKVWGVDIGAEGIKLLREHGIDNLVVGNIKQLDQIEELKQQNFDIILID